MHLDDDRLERWVDDELTDAEQAVARAHLATCAECRERLAAVERTQHEVEDMLGRLDAPLLPGDPRTIMADAARPSSPHHSDPGRSGRWHAGHRSRRALVAAVLLAVTAGGAWAVTRPAVRDWLATTVWFLKPYLGVEVAPPESRDTPEGPEAAGVSIAPGERLRIEFAMTPAPGGVRIVLTSDSMVSVRTADRATTFSSSPGRLIVAGPDGGGPFDLDLPLASPRVEVVFAGRTEFTLERGHVTTQATPDEHGAYRLSPTPR